METGVNETVSSEVPASSCVKATDIKPMDFIARGFVEYSL